MLKINLTAPVQRAALTSYECEDDVRLNLEARTVEFSVTYADASGARPRSQRLTVGVARADLRQLMRAAVAAAVASGQLPSGIEE